MSGTQLFRTSVGSVVPGRITVRGHDMDELIGSTSFTDIVCLVITGRLPSPTERVMVDAIFASAADHGFVSTPTCVARFAASGSGSLPAAVAAGILGIGASTAVPHLIGEMLLSLAGGGDPAAVTDEQIDEVIRGYRARGQRLPGLGHPVHRPVDPRTEALRRVAREQGCYDGYPALVDRVAERFTAVTGKTLTLNVDGMLAAILVQFGWTSEQIFGATILALTPSLVAHGIEELADGLPMRIIAAEHVVYEDSADPRP